MPRQLLQHIDHAGELIEHDALKGGIVAKDTADVGERGLDRSAAIQLQLGLPVFIRGEIPLRLFSTFLGQRLLHTVILHGELAHGLIGRQLRSGRIGSNLVIQITEFVDADEIEGVEQLTTGRVGGVMAVGELAVIKNHTSGGVCGYIVIPARHDAGLVDIGQEVVDSILDTVGAAECADHTGFGKRVGLFSSLAMDGLALAGGNRPCAGIAPIGVPGQVYVRVEQRAVLLFKDKLAVGGSRRPVHQAAGFIGGIVKQVDADFLGDHATQRRVLLFADLAGQRDDQAQTRHFRGVLMGGVHAALPAFQHGDLFPNARFAVVHVQRGHRPAEHIAILAAAFLQVTGDEAAHILDAILFALFHLAVFLHGFRGAHGLGDAGDERLPSHFFVLPVLVHAAAADCDFHADTSLQAVSK